MNVFTAAASPRVLAQIDNQMSELELPVTSAISQSMSYLRVRMARVAPLRLVMIAATILVLAQISFAKGTYTLKPAPAWVKQTPVSKPAASVTSQASGSLFLLSDNQIRVAKNSIERYSRRVRKVVNASGLEDLSQVQLEFEPTYEELVIHHVRIQRGDATIDALRPNEIKVIQQETDLNERIYNGTLSALILLNDVRVGDIIDYAYSIVGANPVLGGRYADTYSLASGQYVGKILWRLVWPSSRSLQYRGLNSNATPAIQQNGEETEYVWSQDDVAAVEFEDNIPRWFRPVPTIQLSEFANWADVVKWALPLYTLKQPLDAALKTQIDHWASESGDPEKRLISAVRFVQDEVRYMGIELGPSSHTPTNPSTVFKRRFGDCKDKTFLLTTILKALGIDAIPALVNTNAKDTLDAYQPSPLAFDHVILKVTFNGNTYWVDATTSLQRGTLAEESNLDYRRALVVRDGNSALEEMPDKIGDESTTTLREVYTVSSYDSPAFLEVDTTYKGNDADDMRGWIAQHTLAELAKTWLNYYASIDPDVQAPSLPAIADDINANVIVTTEHYIIPNFWKKRAREFYAGRINEEFGKLSVSRRSMPLALSYPVRVSQIIVAHLPEAIEIDRKGSTIESDAIRYKYRYDFSGKTLTLSYELQTRKDYVAAEKVAEHLALVDRIRGTLGYELSMNKNDSENTAAVILLALIFTPILIFSAIKVVKSKRSKQRQTSFTRNMRPRYGESPETAINLEEGRDLDQSLTEFKCACGHSYQARADTHQRESATFDGRRLTIVRLNCDTCRRIRDVYFANQGSTVLQD